MSRIRITLFYITLLTIISSPNSHANEIHVNVGAMTFSFIPVFTGEIEYEFSRYTVRESFYSNFDFNLLGSSVYKGKAVEFAYRTDEKNERIYLSIGSGAKREGTTNDENHRFIGVGFENYFRKDPGDSSPGQGFVRLYGQIIEYEDVEGPDFTKDELPMAGIMLGMRF